MHAWSIELGIHWHSQADFGDCAHCRDLLTLCKGLQAQNQEVPDVLPTPQQQQCVQEVWTKMIDALGYILGFVDNQSLRRYFKHDQIPMGFNSNTQTNHRPDKVKSLVEWKVASTVVCEYGHLVKVDVIPATSMSVCPTDQDMLEDLVASQIAPSPERVHNGQCEKCCRQGRPKNKIPLVITECVQVLPENLVVHIQRAQFGGKVRCTQSYWTGLTHTAFKLSHKHHTDQLTSEVWSPQDLEIDGPAGQKVFTPAKTYCGNSRGKLNQYV